MQTFGRFFSEASFEIFDKLIGGQLCQTVEKIESLKDSLIEIFHSHIHDSAFDNFLKETFFPFFALHLLGHY
jgi:hypothetical protein